MRCYAVPWIVQRASCYRGKDVPISRFGNRLPDVPIILPAQRCSLYLEPTGSLAIDRLRRDGRLHPV